MTPKAKRLLQKEVEEVFKYGKMVKTTHLSFKFLKTDPHNPQKVSVVVSKKVVKTAVGRNYLKRRGYLALRGHLSSLPKGVLGVVIFGGRSQEVFGVKSKKNKKESLDLLKEEIKSLLSKVT